jgi:hypothetical protein
MNDQQIKYKLFLANIKFNKKEFIKFKKAIKNAKTAFLQFGSTLNTEDIINLFININNANLTNN